MRAYRLTSVLVTLCSSVRGRIASGCLQCGPEIINSPLCESFFLSYTQVPLSFYITLSVILLFPASKRHPVSCDDVLISNLTPCAHSAIKIVVKASKIITSFRVSFLLIPSSSLQQSDPLLITSVVLYDFNHWV